MIAACLFRQEFQRHVAVQLRIFRFIHHAHSAAAELADNPVMGDELAVHG